MSSANCMGGVPGRWQRMHTEVETGEHGRGGLFGGMSGVADRAAGPALVIKNPAVPRAGESIGGVRMTLGAGLGNALWTDG